MQYIWNNDRQKAFRAALLDVYRDYSELKIFVNDALEKNLGEIIGSNEGLEIVVFKLVDWADAKKRLPDLYRYFCDDNPDHDFSNAADATDRALASISAPTNLNRYRRSIPKFVGRDRAMRELSELVADAGTVAIAAAVSGMGGLGKTELAWQWANREYTAGRFPGGVVWLDVAAGNPGEQLLLFCQTEFAIEVPELPTIAERVAYCWQQWSNWRAGDVLVVFDDVARDRDASELQGLQPGSGAFRTLWTTRDRWSGVRLYPLDKLDDDAARELLASYIDASRLDDEPDAIEALLRWFDGLPLGLELAARYLALDEFLEIGEYMAELNLTHESLQQNPEMRYPDGVEAAIAVSWARLDSEDGRAARRLALRLGLFGAAPIPVLADWRQEWRKPLQRLVSLNLVQRDAATVGLHPLVRQFVRGRLGLELSAEAGDELRREVAAAIVEQGERVDYPCTMEQTQEYAPWVPHLVEIANTLLPWVVDEQVVTPCTGLTRFYIGKGLYERAQPWSEQCLAIVCERLGYQHILVSAVLSNAAELSRLQGNYTKAKACLVKALDIAQKQLPANSLGLTPILNNLGLICDLQGDYEESEYFYLASLAIKKRELPYDHPFLATALNNLAEIYRVQGEHELAKRYYDEALKIDRTNFPQGHPDIITGLNNRAMLHLSQNEYKKAEETLSEALAIAKNCLPLTHPTLIPIYINFSAVLKAKGENLKAISLLHQALQICQESLSPTHPQLAAVLNNLAAMHELQGKHKEAEDYYRKALKICRVSLPGKHFDLATLLSNLAGVCRWQEKYDSAELLFLEALENMTSGTHLHPEIQTLWSNVIGFYQTALAAGHPDTRLRNHPLGDLIRSRLQ